MYGYRWGKNRYSKQKLFFLIQEKQLMTKYNKIASNNIFLQINSALKRKSSHCKLQNHLKAKRISLRLKWTSEFKKCVRTILEFLLIIQAVNSQQMITIWVSRKNQIRS